MIVFYYVRSEREHVEKVSNSLPLFIYEYILVCLAAEKNSSQADRVVKISNFIQTRTFSLVQNEATSLLRLTAESAIRIPKIYNSGPRFIVEEFIDGQTLEKAKRILFAITNIYLYFFWL